MLNHPGLNKILEKAGSGDWKWKQHMTNLTSASSVAFAARSLETGLHRL
jgi:hypothetical protein